MKRSKGFLLLVMMLLGLFCLSSPSWAEAACSEGELQQYYTGRVIRMYGKEPMWCVGLELLQARYGLPSCAPMSK